MRISPTLNRQAYVNHESDRTNMNEIPVMVRSVVLAAFYLQHP